MEIKEEIKKPGYIGELLHPRVLNVTFTQTENGPAGNSMYYNEEERDMVIARLLFYGIVCVVAVAVVVIGAIIIF